ncbi:MAG: FtsX-like permease family protein, partial [Ekhidna sp.]
ITLRNILKNKGSSYLNIASLTFGIAVCLFIFHYIYFELNYDTSPSENNVYRVESQFFDDEGLSYQEARTSMSAAPFLQQEFAEIKDYTRIISFSEEGTGLFRKQKNDSVEVGVYIPKVFYAEQSIFSVFSLPLEEGDKSTCLTEPNSILLSSKTANDIFEKELASGKSIIGKKLKSPGIGNVVEEFVITGIFTDRPTNTHIKFDALVAKPMDRKVHRIESEEKNNTYSYVAIANQVLSEDLTNGVNYPEKVSLNKLALRPINEVHLASGISGNTEPGANKRLITFLSIIAVIILLLASTNHTNNSIFNSIDRAKEIGVRKLLGIKPKQLFFTLLGEAFLVNLISTIGAIVIFLIGVQSVQVHTGIAYPSFKDADLIVYLEAILSLLIISTVLSGTYPSFYLTSLSPIASLKSKYELMSSRQFSSAGRVIKYLLIFQLGVSICFLSGLYIVYAQLQYLKESGRSPLEVSITGIFPGSSGAGEKFTEEAYFGLNEYQKTNALEAYAISNLYKNEIKTVQWLRLDSIDELIKISVVDHAYIQKSDISFLSGRNFHHVFGSDAGNAIITREAMYIAGYNHPDSIIDKTLISKGSRWKVIGVIKNRSSSKEPEIYVTGFRYRTYVDVILNYPGGKGETLNQFLDKNEYYLAKALPFFSLFKRNYQNQATSEESMMKLFLFLSIMTLVIANMGMLGLSSFIAQKKQKEIGIRKILGAESMHILVVLLLDFLKLIGLASIIAIPLVLVGSKNWLENYAFRISVDPSMILIPLLIVFLIALVVVAEKCFKLAMASPLKSLKN